MQALQNQVTDNQNCTQALQTLQPAVANVATDIAELGTLATGGGITASSSDSNTISVENVSATTPANYTISNITVATAASETSLAKYADATTAPIGVAGQTQFQLVVGSNTYNLNLSGNDNLTGLQSAIESSGAPVTASIINTGSGDYLTLTANNVGAATLQLNAVPQQASLITNNGTGTETGLYSYASATTTPVSNSGIVDLTVGGGSAIQLDISANNNLTGLMNAINGANAGVTASITTNNGKSSLQLTDASGPTSITLDDMPPASSVDLISNTGTGTETSVTGYTDPNNTAVSSTGTVDLSVGGGAAIPLNISGANNNLTGLMNAINNADAGVTASITTSNGQSYLQVTDPSGPTSITLNDTLSAASTNLITDSDQGTNASFTLNGNIQIANQATNTFNSVIPGVSFTLLQNDSSGSVDISLSADPTQLASALQNLTTDYNTLMTDVNQEIGQNAGPLASDTIIDTISDDLRQLTAYWLSNSTSSVRSLSDLGITFNDTTGQMSFDSSVVDNFTSSQMGDAFTFLGSSNSGFAALANNFTQVSDPASGMIEDQELGYQTDDTNLNDEISTDEDQITTLQTNMTTQLEAADALVDQLQNEQSQVQAEVESVDYVDFGAPLSSSTA